MEEALKQIRWWRWWSSFQGFVKINTNCLFIFSKRISIYFHKSIDSAPPPPPHENASSIGIFSF
jgi:Trk-type K+ transport system membrane component